MQTASRSNSGNIKVDYTELKKFLQAKANKKAPQSLKDKIKNIPSMLQNPTSSSL